MGTGWVPMGTRCRGEVRSIPDQVAQDPANCAFAYRQDPCYKASPMERTDTPMSASSDLRVPTRRARYYWYWRFT